MAFGYEVFNSATELVTSNDGATGIILGFIEITSGNQADSLTNADLAMGTPFHWILAPGASVTAVPGVSFSGTTMTWTAAPGGTFLGYIWYGIK